MNNFKNRNRKLNLIKLSSGAMFFTTLTLPLSAVSIKASATVRKPLVLSMGIGSRLGTSGQMKDLLKNPYSGGKTDTPLKRYSDFLSGRNPLSSGGTNLSKSFTTTLTTKLGPKTTKTITISDQQQTPTTQQPTPSTFRSTLSVRIGSRSQNAIITQSGESTGTTVVREQSTGTPSNLSVRRHSTGSIVQGTSDQPEKTRRNSIGTTGSSSDTPKKKTDYQALGAKPKTSAPTKSTQDTQEKTTPTPVTKLQDFSDDEKRKIIHMPEKVVRQVGGSLIMVEEGEILKVTKVNGEIVRTPLGNIKDLEQSPSTPIQHTSSTGTTSRRSSTDSTTGQDNGDAGTRPSSPSLSQNVGEDDPTTQDKKKDLINITDKTRRDSTDSTTKGDTDSPKTQPSSPSLSQNDKAVNPNLLSKKLMDLTDKRGEKHTSNVNVQNLRKQFESQGTSDSDTQGKNPVSRVVVPGLVQLFEGLSQYKIPSPVVPPRIPRPTTSTSTTTTSQATSTSKTTTTTSTSTRPTPTTSTTTTATSAPTDSTSSQSTSTTNTITGLPQVVKISSKETFTRGNQKITGIIKLKFLNPVDIDKVEIKSKVHFE